MKIFTIVFLAIALTCGEFALTGCKTSQIGTVTKAEGVLITAVNTGMAVWGDYVRAGHATQAQVDTVKTAYNAYYNAQQLAKAAIEKALASGNPATSQADVDTANAAVTNAETALISVINQFITAK